MCVRVWQTQTEKKRKPVIGHCCSVEAVHVARLEFELRIARREAKRVLEKIGPTPAPHTYQYIPSWLLMRA